MTLLEERRHFAPFLHFCFRQTEGVTKTLRVYFGVSSEILGDDGQPGVALAAIINLGRQPLEPRRASIVGLRGTTSVYEMVQTKAHYCRQKAAEARQAAQQMRHPESRDQLLEIAEAFESLAARLDARDRSWVNAVNQRWTA